MREEEMWEAVKNNNESYDGVFFYGVKTTGIYCRPSCKSKRPKRKNIEFFQTSESAIEAGFRPCKRCRSDLLDYEPMKEIANKLKEKIDKAFEEQEKLSNESLNMGLSSRRIVEVFKLEYGITPKAYTDSLRLEACKKLLRNSDKKVMDISYGVGFGSISAFYKFFRKEMGCTPMEYRNFKEED